MIALMIYLSKTTDYADFIVGLDKEHCTGKVRYYFNNIRQPEIVLPVDCGVTFLAVMKACAKLKAHLDSGGELTDIVFQS